MVWNLYTLSNCFSLTRSFVSLAELSRGGGGRVREAMKQMGGEKQRWRETSDRGLESTLVFSTHMVANHHPQL